MILPRGHAKIICIRKNLFRGESHNGHSTSQRYLHGVWHACLGSSRCWVRGHIFTDTELIFDRGPPSRHMITFRQWKMLSAIFWGID